VSRARVLRRRASSENLDSLLDTMANVVGILIVLLAVVQVTVGDAMDRIRVLDSEEGRALADEQQQLEARLAALAPDAKTDRRSLERLREELGRLLADPEAAQLRSDAAAAATAAAARAAELRALERAVAEQRRRLVAMQVRVDGRASDGPADPVELRLPDPRPAPPNADRVVMLARYGRVLAPDLEGLEARMNDVIQQWAAAGNGVRGREARALAEHVARLDLGNRWLRWEMIEQGGLPIARLLWRDRDAGDDEQALASPEASFRRALARLDPERHFLRFWVWSDSFETYLAARRIAEEAGFAVGWEVLAEDEPLQGGLGRGRIPAAPVD
jgi:hypothetical protein